MQQTTDNFLNLPPTLPGEEKGQGVLTQKSVDKYTKHVRLFIQNVSHAWFPIAVLEEDKYFVVFISLLTLSWAKFRPGPPIFVHKHTIFQLPHLYPVYTLCSKYGNCDHVQRTMSYYGPYPGPVWQLGVESRVTLATVGFFCQGSLLDLRPLPRVT